MKAELIVIGDEIISGRVKDTNSPYLFGRLDLLGIEVKSLHKVGDKKENIAQQLIDSLRGSDFIIVTGGLGPTEDDMSREAASMAFKRRLLINEDAMGMVSKKFEEWNIKPSELDKKQALMPEGSEVIPNPLGTACGFKVAVDSRAIYFLPGVPNEMRAMFEGYILPQLQKEKREICFSCLQVYKIFGITEAYVGERIQKSFYQNMDGLDRLKIAYLPDFPEIKLEIRIWDKDEESVHRRGKEIEKVITSLFGDYLYTKEDISLEETVSRLLKESGQTLAIAESLTGGLISKRLTEISGSSQYLERGLVVYSNRSKTELLDIPASLIQRVGAVSREVSQEMASKVREMARTDLGLSCTGIAGPEGGTKKKPVGSVYISLARREKVDTKFYHFPGDRNQVRLLTSEVALDWLRRDLKGVTMPEKLW